jgi:LAO/AO transport system kinase
MAVAELAARIRAGDRRALARGITLVESSLRADELEAEALLSALGPLPQGGLRIGISGAPGVGKSSLLEVLGLHVLQSGSQLGLLAIDPSSRVTGGSILGDKTRMARLSREAGAYVRPSPSGPGAGGVAPRTAEAVLLCEAAGFSPVFVETVGVGQAETAVTLVVDLLVLLIEPGAGDALQGIKRGLIEYVDLLVVNKADGPRRALAESSATEYANALRLLRFDGGSLPPVLCVSALEGTGVAALWQAILGRFAELESAGKIELKRGAQRRERLRQRVEAEALRRFFAGGTQAQRYAELEAAVAAGQVSVSEAVRRLFGG